MARRPFAARFVVYLSCLAAGIVVQTSATRFGSAAAPHHQHHQEERQLQPHEVAEWCRAAKGFPQVKDISRTDGGLLKSAVLHFTREWELPEGAQLTTGWYFFDERTAAGAPRLVDREYGREYLLDEFQIIVPFQVPLEDAQEPVAEVPEGDDAELSAAMAEMHLQPQPHEEAVAEMAAKRKTLREELWVLVGALDRRLHLLERREWFVWKKDGILETVAGLVFPAQVAALRALLGEQIALGYEDTAAARLRQLRGLAVGVEALSKRIDLQEQLQALEGLPRMHAGSGLHQYAAGEPPLLLTQKMGISRENVSKFIQPAHRFVFAPNAMPRFDDALPYLMDPVSGKSLSVADFRYLYSGKASGVLFPGSYLTPAGSADHQTVVADLLLDVEQAEARVAEFRRWAFPVELRVLVAAVCHTWRNSQYKWANLKVALLNRGVLSAPTWEKMKYFGDRLDEILTELKEHTRMTTPPPGLAVAPEQQEEIGATLTQPNRLLRLAELPLQLLKLQAGCRQIAEAWQLRAD
eukprot:g18751.t1